MTRIPRHVMPVAGVDIDGTIAKYHSHFTAFANEWTGRALGNPTPYFGEDPFHVYLGLSKRQYREVKLAYRRSGLKRSMPTVFGSEEFVRRLRKNCRVVFCTTRPYLSIDNIEPDTVEFLRRNGIKYDGLILGHLKYQALRDQYGEENILGVIDDDPAMVRSAIKSRLHARLITRASNSNHCSNDVPRVTNFVEATNFFDERFNEWRAAR